MKTIGSTIIKLSGSIIVSVSLAFGLNAQSPEKKNATTPINPAEKLMLEADRMQEQADILRQNAQGLSGEARRMMLLESSAIEKMSLEKKYKSLQISYQEKLSITKANELKIEKYRTLIVEQKHKSHTKFLVEDARKNRRQSEELYQESQAGHNSASQLGNIENAIEKIQLALNQQLNIFQLLKEEEEAKVASRP